MAAFSRASVSDSHASSVWYSRLLTRTVQVYPVDVGPVPALVDGPA